jgi:hypothetical protein
MKKLIDNLTMKDSSGLTLILSGNIFNQQSTDLRPFWQGFIELQSRISSKKPVRQIVAHSWNPDLADLVRIVYAPQIERHEKHDDFSWDSIHHLTTTDYFAECCNYDKSLLKEGSIWPMQLEAQSRSLAVRLMEQLPEKQNQVLLSCWDVGRLGYETANKLIVDISLPEDYIYLSYSSDIDMGYPDIWVLAPLDIARQFASFDKFAVDTLSSQNDYLLLLNKTWHPHYWAKFLHRIFLLNLVRRKFQVKALKVTKDFLESSNIDGLFPAIIRRFLRVIQRTLAQSCITAENSCLTSINRVMQVFPKPLTINSATLLKYFIHFNRLRDRTRFLTEEDFEVNFESGQLINPQPIIIIFYADVDVDLDAEVSRLITRSKLPLAGIYQLYNGVVMEYLLDSQGEWDSVIKTTLTGSLNNQILGTLRVAHNHFAGSLPTLLLPSIDYYLRCTDQFYLNALMKYIAWYRLDYVALDCSLRGSVQLDFPDLYMMTSGKLSIVPAAGTVNGLHSFLDTMNLENINSFIETNRTLKEFPAICRDRKLFEGLNGGNV